LGEFLEQLCLLLRRHADAGIEASRLFDGRTKKERSGLQSAMN
jgi:hypothetical protein